MPIRGGSDLTVGITGLAGFITLAIFLAGLFVYDYFVTDEKIMISTINDTR